MATVRSGWLEKLSGTIFRSWKRKYIVLYRDGELAIYDNPNDSTSDTRLQLRTDLDDIETGLACGSLNLPKGKSNIDALFSVKTKHHSTVYFVALSDRDASEWVAAIRHAKNPYIPHNSAIPGAPPSNVKVQQNFNQPPPIGFQQHVSGVPPPAYSNEQYPQPQYQVQPQYQSQPQYQAYQQGNAPPVGYPQVQGYQPQTYVVQQPMQAQPMMYAAPQGYAQPGYAQRQPQYQQQQQQSGGNGRRNMLLGAAGGGLAGFALGGLMGGGMGHGFGGGFGGGHHGSFDHDHGSFDGGDFGGGDFGGGDFDF